MKIVIPICLPKKTVLEINVVPISYSISFRTCNYTMYLQQQQNKQRMLNYMFSFLAFKALIRGDV